MVSWHAQGHLVRSDSTTGSGTAPTQCWATSQTLPCIASALCHLWCCPLSVRGWSMAGSENRANNIQIGAWGISTRTAPRLITLDLSRYTTAAEYVEKGWSKFRFSSRSFTMIREIWARILVQVTVYRRLRIDRDEMAISTNPKPTIMTRYIVTCTRLRALVIQYTIVLSIRSWAWHNGDNAFSRRLYPVWY